MAIELPSDRLSWARKRIAEYAAYWNDEIPLRMHNRETDDGGTPQWHPDFARWLLRTDVDDKKWRHHPEPRVRTTRAFRKLREKFPREYEVLYRTAILQIPLATTVEWLNARAERHGHPERYTRADVMLILIVAIEKVDSWY